MGDLDGKGNIIAKKQVLAAGTYNVWLAMVYKRAAANAPGGFEYDSKLSSIETIVIK